MGHTRPILAKKLSLPIVAIIVLSGLFMSPQGAFGQGSTWVGENLSRMVEAAKWRWGVLRANSAFELASAGYDTDIYYGYLEEPFPDYTFSAGVPVQLLLPLGKKIVLDIFDSPRYIFYFDAKNERAWNNTFRGQAHVALERIYIQAGGGLADNRQRLSPELNINVRQKENSLNGLILWQVSQSTSLAFLHKRKEYSYGDAEYEGMSLSETLNRKENFSDIITYLQPNSRVRFYMDGQFGTYSFTHPASTFKNSRSYGVLGGLEFIPRPGETQRSSGIRGTISLGYKRFDVILPQLADGSGLVGTADVSAGLFKKTMARLAFSRDFQFSAYSDATFYTAMGFAGGITRFLSRKASLSYDLSFSRSSYPESGGAGGISGGIIKYTTHMFVLDIRLAENLGVTFLGTLGMRTLDENAPARKRNFFGFTLTYGSTPTQISAPVSALSR
jgi:hypothetical protein